MLLLLACTTDPKDSSPAVDCTPAPPEVSRIDAPTGYRNFSIPVTAPWLDNREVPLNLWYNTQETSGDSAMFLGLFKDEHSLVDAPFSDPSVGCKLPLVVYSHGSQAWGGSNSPLLRHLVSQGWVAAAPDHVGNTLTDNVDPRPVSFSLTRMADIRATIDAIENLPEEDPLYGRVDTSRVLLAGHSFGGQTSWLFAGPTLDAVTLNGRCDAGAPGCTDAEREAFTMDQTDPRIIGVMPLDGFADTDVVAEEGWSTAKLPILYLAKSQDGDETPITRAANANLIWARFEGACHETFNNSPVSCETFDKTEGMDLTAAFFTAFAAEQMFGMVEEPYTGILDGSTSLDDRITVQRTSNASP